jgi:hypothetical protein
MNILQTNPGFLNGFVRGNTDEMFFHAIYSTEEPEEEKQNIKP